MKEIIIKVSGSTSYPFVVIDNNRVDFKLNNYGNYEGTIKVDREMPNIEIYCLPHEMVSKGAFFYNFISFIVGVCGIFSPKYSKDNYSFTFKGKLNTVTTNSLHLYFNRYDVNKPAVILKDGVIEDIEGNKLTVDKRVKKRRGLYSFFKLLCIIGLAFLINYLLTK